MTTGVAGRRRRQSVAGSPPTGTPGAGERVSRGRKTRRPAVPLESLSDVLARTPRAQEAAGRGADIILTKQEERAAALLLL